MSKLSSKHLITVLFLGFSSGLPLALTGTTLQAWIASDQGSILTIGFLGLVGQPYVYKFLWSPFLDRYRPPLLSRRRGWIAFMQICLSMGIAMMAFGQPLTHLTFLAGIALMVAFLSATQDIAIDAYRTDLLTQKERGLGSAFAIMGYRIGMLVSGGVGLMIADHYGWRVMYLLMAVVMLLNVFVTWQSPDSVDSTPPVSLKEAILVPWRALKQRAQIGTLLLWFVFYKIGEAYTLSLSSAFFIEYLHFSLSTVGVMYKIVALIGSILGGIIGGMILSRKSLFSCLLGFGIGQSLCAFLYMGMAVCGKSLLLLGVTVFTDYFFGGMSTAAMIAFITALCDKRFSASQFAIFSAITSIPRVFIAPIAGFSVQMLGWAHFFFLAFFVSLPGLWLLWCLRNSYDEVLSKIPA